MRKFAIVARNDEESQQIKRYFEEKLQKNKFELVKEPEVVIAIGGDGTMLEAFRQFGTKAHYVGIHTGTLGFYADWQKEEKEQLLAEIIGNVEPEIVEYPLVEIDFQVMDGRQERHLALNEVVVKSRSLATFILDVAINGEQFETFRGDGLIISTPSGSTAYNYSVLGSVLHPSFEAIQIAELAAINNGVFRTLNRSFILPKHHTLSLFIQNEDKKALIGIDGVELELTSIQKIEAKVSDEKIKFIRYRSLPFWERIKDKFLT